MFTPNYINDIEGFVVRMPSTYVSILLTAEPFTAGDVIKFRLQPKVYTDSKSKAKVDTGDYWAHVIIHPTSAVHESDVIPFVKSHFSRAHLNPVDVTILVDRNTGAGLNKVRVAFLPMDTFDPRNLKTLAKLAAPDGKIWHTQLSKGAAYRFNVCLNCLGMKNTPRSLPLSIQCGCSDMKSVNTGSTAAQRATAREQYQRRALKRAREAADPFA